MPTYEYRCSNGHDFEKFYRSIASAATEVACPTCGVIAERQLSAGGALMFKGSGFYLTDYGKNAHATKAPSTSQGGDGGGDGGPEGKSSEASAPERGSTDAPKGVDGPPAAAATGDKAAPRDAETTKPPSDKPSSSKATSDKPAATKPSRGSSGSKPKSE